MVRIRKRAVEGGHVYQVEDFEAYRRALTARGIAPPLANVNVFVSEENEQLISATCSDWETQIALLFKLSEASGIPYEVVSE